MIVYLFYKGNKMLLKSGILVYMATFTPYRPKSIDKASYVINWEGKFECERKKRKCQPVVSDSWDGKREWNTIYNLKILLKEKIALLLYIRGNKEYREDTRKSELASLMSTRWKSVFLLIPKFSIKEEPKFSVGCEEVNAL